MFGLPLDSLSNNVWPGLTAAEKDLRVAKKCQYS